jgi:CRP-like cAMP-binding protein
VQPHFLHRVFQPTEFSAEELQQIMAQFKKVHFQRNDFLLREGNTEHYYWFIESGFARAYVVDTEGNDITTHFFCAGDVVIDWSSFFLRNPTRETIQALSDCTCWQIDFEKFQTLFHTIKAFREQGRSNLVGSYFALKNRSISMITEDAKQRYTQLVREHPELIQNASLKHIASYLGITDTSLSRIRKEMTKG